MQPMCGSGWDGFNFGMVNPYCFATDTVLHPAPVCIPTIRLIVDSLPLKRKPNLVMVCMWYAGMFKAQSFYDMMDRLWTAIFDLLLRMSNMFRDKCTGIIFLIANHNHIRA